MRSDYQIIIDIIPENSSVLDIGCGDGELLEQLLEKKKVKAHGIELSQAGVSECVAKGLAVIQGDADKDLQYYPDNCFDVVICTQMLQATRDPKWVLEEIHRISKNAIISVPNFGHWYNRIYLMFKGKMPVTEKLAYQWYETPNIHFCTTKDFEILCNELHFDLAKKMYIGSDGKRLGKGVAGVSHLRRKLANLLSEQAVYFLQKSPHCIIYDI